MCGIFYLSGASQLGEVTLRKAVSSLESLSYRGPDNCEYKLYQGAFIGHTRLSIVDLDAGANQPFVSNDKRYVITYNGEIYNHKELRSILMDQGASLATSSDTEVVLELFRLKGAEAFSMLRGMYAVVIYDTETGVTHVATDQIGKKPLFWAIWDDLLIIASSVDAIARFIPDLNVDPDALSILFHPRLRSLYPPYTPFQEIRRFEPGIYETFKAAEKLHAEPIVYRYPEGEDVGRSIRDAITLRTQADVPVASLLSGGMDSAVIAQLASRYQDLTCLTIGRDAQDPDVIASQSVASVLGVKHTILFEDGDETYTEFTKLVEASGDYVPLMNLAHLSSLFKRVRESGIKCVLTGNGADELFFGYRSIKTYSKLFPLLNLIPSWSRRLDLGVWFLAPNGLRRAKYFGNLYEDSIGVFDEASTRSKIFSDIGAKLKVEEPCTIEEEVILSSFFFENHHSLAMASDLPAMVNSVEARSPFMDIHVLSGARRLTLKNDYKTSKGSIHTKLPVFNLLSKHTKEAILKIKTGLGASLGERERIISWKDEYLQLCKASSYKFGALENSDFLAAWGKFENGGLSAGTILKLFNVLILRAKYNEKLR